MESLISEEERIGMFNVWVSSKGRLILNELIQDAEDEKQREKQLFDLLQDVWERSLDFKLIRNA